MNWIRYIDMAEWPYPLQETFKGATVLFMLLACFMLWRRWSGRRNPWSFTSIAWFVSLAVVSGMELAAVVLRLWPYFFGFPRDELLLGHIYKSGTPLSLLAVCSGVLGVIGRQRTGWSILLLTLAFFFQWTMFVSGEPALVVY